MRTSRNVMTLVLLWMVGSCSAGVAIGLAVSVFTDEGLQAPTLAISILLGNVVGLSALVCSVFLFPQLQEVPSWLRPGLLGLALMSASVVGTIGVIQLYPLFVLRGPRQTIAIVVLDATLALIVGAIAYGYEVMRHRLQASMREIEQVRLVEARLREDAAKAELAALQAQINPHFFFNTLNTIAALLDDDPDAAEEVVETLAELFRYTFKASATEAVRFEEELAFIRNYLTIERARFGERLRIEWEIAPDTRRVRIPGLVLQPLVENAVGHGISPSNRGGTVRIVARRESARLLVEVHDDGAGLDQQARPWIREGHGLDNIRRRLQTLYTRRSVLELKPGPGGVGATSRLELPARPEDELEISQPPTERLRRHGHAVSIGRSAREKVR